MTLFIACLLIYEFEMGWEFYVAALAIWIAHLTFWHGSFSNLQNALNGLVSLVKRRRGG
jgi:hypothetical protein